VLILIARAVIANYSYNNFKNMTLRKVKLEVATRKRNNYLNTNSVASY